MSQQPKTPLIRLGNLFPQRAVHAKCEFLAPSGCFKIRGATHLLDRLSKTDGLRRLVVPSMGNTALGAAVGAKAYGSCAGPPKSPRNATATSSIRTSTRFGPTATAPLPRRFCKRYRNADRWSSRWAAAGC